MFRMSLTTANGCKSVVNEIMGRYPTVEGILRFADCIGLHIWIIRDAELTCEPNVPLTPRKLPLHTEYIATTVAIVSI